MSETYVYVSECESQQISVLRMSAETGKLTKIQTVTVGGRVMPMAISPDRRFLFAALRNEPYAIASFAIDAVDGTLTSLGLTPAPESTVYICTDHTGRFLLGACNPPDHARRTGLVTINAIGPQGCVQIPPTVMRTPPKLHSIVPDPSNRFVFAPSCDTDTILRFAFDPSRGELSSDGLTPVVVFPKSGPRHLRFHPNGRFLYLMNEYDASVCVYRYDVRSGALYELQIIGALPPDYTGGKGGRGADLHFTPDGKWLYVSVRDSLSIGAFGVDPVTGLLVSVGHFPTVDEPRGFNIDPFGRYLIVAGLYSKSLAQYEINSESGALKRFADFPMDEGPNWVEFARLP
jgi:6-phosphogluconolactonase